MYGLAYQTCHRFTALHGKPVSQPSSTCARLNEAQWARLDPGNALPWIYALNRADQAGDAAAQRDAMDRIAASSHVDLWPFAGAAAVSRLPLQNPADLAAQHDAAMRALSFEMPGWQALTQRCKDGAGGDAALASWCARVATLMFENTNDFWPHLIGGAMHRLLTGDKSWSDRAHDDARLMAERVKSEEVDAPCASERQTLKHLARIGAIGQLGLVREIRAAASAAVSPSSPSRTPARTADPASSRS